MGISEAEADEFLTAWAAPTPVDSTVLSMSLSLLTTSLKHAGCPLPNPLPNDLKNAQGFFLLTILQKQGAVSAASGELRRQTQGKVTTELQPVNPLFFFGGSDTSIRGENIASLLPTMSYWQLGNWMVYTWCEGDISIDETISFSSDRTTRGASWNVVETDITP
jgi:hypothetical protein